MQDNTVKLHDGRILGFSDYGSHSGIPIFLFHGTPGSRICGSELEALTERYGIRVIAPDRPGCGLSDAQPKRKFKDWPADVEALADHLQIDRFHIAGESGGGPYVLACAIRLRERIISATLVGSAAPPDLPQFTKGMASGNRIGFFIVKHAPRFLLKMAFNKLARGVTAHPEKFLEKVRSQLCEWDKQVVEQLYGQGREKEFVLEITEAYRQGADGVYHDSLLVSRAWRLDLNKITVPVFMWHGESDTLMPIACARAFAQLIPNCETHFIPGAGHLLLGSADVGPQIIARLLSAGA